MLGAESQLELEKWMKLLACASYDFMKLMVGELKHKINEIESPVADEAGMPRPPPRNRQNPFNKRDVPKMSWLDWHTEYGQRILRDREQWLQHHESARTEKIEMEGDTLLVVV